MYHEMRWTLEKIAKRLDLIAPLVYIRQTMLDPFRYFELPGPGVPAPVGRDVDDSTWPEIAPNTYWGAWMTDFVLRTSFTVPADWPKDHPVALYLPLGISGDFSTAKPACSTIPRCRVLMPLNSPSTFLASFMLSLMVAVCDRSSRVRAR